MATYAELLTIATSSSGDALRTRVKVATIVAADVVRLEAPATANHANRMTWAKQAIADPNREADKLLWAILAQNRSATAAQITAADDTAVQNAANAAIDLIAGV
jgi:guanyl-specific ribonuclease Sa